MTFKVFKGKYWGENEDLLISELLQNKHNQPLITRVYNKLYKKLVYMAISIRWEHYPTFFTHNLEEVVNDCITYIFTNIWNMKDQSKGKYFSYINMMIRNYFRMLVRGDKNINESVIDNTDVFNKPSSIINTDYCKDMYKVVEIVECLDDSTDVEDIRDNILKELHRLYNKHVLIPEKSWSTPEEILSKVNHQKRKKYLAGAISYMLEDYNSYSLEDMNNYIFENTDLTEAQITMQSYNFFKLTGPFQNNLSKKPNSSYLSNYRLVTENAY